MVLEHKQQFPLASGSPYADAMRKRLIISLLAFVVLGGLVASCGGNRARDGRVAGVVEVCGDALEAANATPADLRRCNPQAGSASIFSTDHRLIARVKLLHGRFGFSVAPGRYLIAWDSRNWPWKQRVISVAGRPTISDIRIPAI